MVGESCRTGGSSGLSNTFLPWFRAFVAEDRQPHHDGLHQHVRKRLLRLAVKASVEPFGSGHGTAASKRPLCPRFGEQGHQPDVRGLPSARQIEVPLISGKADLDTGLDGGWAYLLPATTPIVLVDSRCHHRTIPPGCGCIRSCTLAKRAPVTGKQGVISSVSIILG